MHRPWLLFLSLGLMGCGGGGGVTLYSVTGTVTKGGKPLEGVSVTFTPDKGPSSAARTNSDGRFVLLCQNGRAGAVVGKHKVLLSKSSGAVTTGAVDMSNAQIREEMMKSRAGSEAASRRRGPGAGSKPPEAAETEVPKEYSDPTKTPLAYTVEAKSNEFDIPIP